MFANIDNWGPLNLVHCGKFDCDHDSWPIFIDFYCLSQQCHIANFCDNLLYIENDCGIDSINIFPCDYGLSIWWCSSSEKYENWGLERCFPENKLSFKKKKSLKITILLIMKVVKAVIFWQHNCVNGRVYTFCIILSFTPPMVEGVKTHRQIPYVRGQVSPYTLTLSRWTQLYATDIIQL